ncbi:MAG: alpha/beta hydrolase [Acidobacteriota bacterium]
MMRDRRTFLLTSFMTLFLLAGAGLAHDPIRIETTTSDQVQIVGDYWTPIRGGKSAPVVILLHMFRSDRSAWNREAIVPLEMAGFAVVRIDLRGHGESLKPEEQRLAQRVRDRDSKLFNAMDQDVEAVVQWLSRRPEVDTGRIGLVGASVGCSVALDYARHHPSVGAVVLMSPGTRYLGVDSLAHIQEYGKRPLLMLTSEQESRGGFQELLRQAGQSGAQVDSLIFPQENIHGTRMLGKVEGIGERIATFLKKNLQLPREAMS